MRPSAGTGYCIPTYFVDGYEWNARTMGAPIDPPGPRSPLVPPAPYTTANVASIEVYSTERERPLRFQGDYQCGVIVLWTK
jgi:hypothetical protein